MIRTTLLALVALAAAPAIAQPARAPVVVELFQSQGCSSCPPANAYVNAIAGRADVLALSFAVTYWDQLGWKDRFARAAYTDRQWDYAHARALPDVATPELIVNGRHGARGSDRRALDGALAAGAKDAPAISVSIGADGVTVGAGAVSGRGRLAGALRSPRARGADHARRERWADAATPQHRQAARTARPVSRHIGALCAATRAGSGAADRCAGADTARRPHIGGGQGLTGHPSPALVAPRGTL